MLVITLMGAAAATGITFFSHSPHDSFVLMGIVETPWIGLIASATLRVASLVLAAYIFFARQPLAVRPTASFALFVSLLLVNGLQVLAQSLNLQAALLGIFPVILIAGAVSTLRLQLSDLRIFGILGVLLSLATAIFALMYPATAFMPNGWNEKLLGDTPALAGFFNHSNTLGLTLALAYPFCFLLRRHLTRTLGAILIVALVLLSGSRTALFSVAVSSVLFVTWLLKPTITRAVLRLAALGAFLAVALVPLVATQPADFSDRALIWLWIRAQLSTPLDVLLGVSAQWPDRATTWSVGAPATSAHNLVMQWIFTGGLLAVGLGTAFLVSTWRHAERTIGPTEVPVPAIFLVALLYISCFEFVLEPSLGSPLFSTALVPLMAISALQPAISTPAKYNKRSRQLNQ